MFTRKVFGKAITIGNELARAYDGAAQRAALQLPPRRAAETVKMRTISRAEGGQLQAPVGRHGQLREPVLKPNTGDPLIMALVIRDYNQAMFKASGRDQDVGITD